MLIFDVELIKVNPTNQQKSINIDSADDLKALQQQLQQHSHSHSPQASATTK